MWPLISWLQVQSTFSGVKLPTALLQPSHCPQAGLWSGRPWHWSLSLSRGCSSTSQGSATVFREVHSCGWAPPSSYNHRFCTQPLPKPGSHATPLPSCPASHRAHPNSSTCSSGPFGSQPALLASPASFLASRA